MSLKWFLFQVLLSTTIGWRDIGSEADSGLIYFSFAQKNATIFIYTARDKEKLRIECCLRLFALISIRRSINSNEKAAEQFLSVLKIKRKNTLWASRDQPNREISPSSCLARSGYESTGTFLRVFTSAEDG